MPYDVAFGHSLAPSLPIIQTPCTQVKPIEASNSFQFIYLVYYSEMDAGSSLLPLEADMETAEEYEHTIATNIAQLGIVIYEVSTALDVTSGIVTISMVEG